MALLFMNPILFLLKRTMVLKRNLIYLIMKHFMVDQLLGVEVVMQEDEVGEEDHLLVEQAEEVLLLVLMMEGIH